MKDKLLDNALGSFIRWVKCLVRDESSSESLENETITKQIQTVTQISTATIEQSGPRLSPTTMLLFDRMFLLTDVAQVYQAALEAEQMLERAISAKADPLSDRCFKLICDANVDQELSNHAFMILLEVLSLTKGNIREAKRPISAKVQLSLAALKSSARRVLFAALATSPMNTWDALVQD